MGLALLVSSLAALIAFASILQNWDGLFPSSPEPYSDMWVIAMESHEFATFTSVMVFLVVFFILLLFVKGGSQWSIISTLRLLRETLSETLVPQRSSTRTLHFFGVRRLANLALLVRDNASRLGRGYEEGYFGARHAEFFNHIRRFGIRLNSGSKKRNIAFLIRRKTHIIEAIEDVGTLLANPTATITEEEILIARALEESLDGLGLEALESYPERVRHSLDGHPILEFFLILLLAVGAVSILFVPLGFVSQQNMAIIIMETVIAGSVVTGVYYQYKRVSSK